MRSKPCVLHRVGVTGREWVSVGLVMDEVGYVYYIPELGRCQASPDDRIRVDDH